MKQIALLVSCDTAGYPALDQLHKLLEEGYTVVNVTPTTYPKSVVGRDSVAVTSVTSNIIYILQAPEQATYA